MSFGGGGIYVDPPVVAVAGVVVPRDPTFAVGARVAAGDAVPGAQLSGTQLAFGDGAAALDTSVVRTGAGVLALQSSGITTASINATDLILGAGKNLSATAGAGAVSLGSMTGAVTLPTGDATWAGAANKNLSLTAAGTGTITLDTNTGAIAIGTGGTVKSCTFGSSTGASATRAQSGGTLSLTTFGGVVVMETSYGGVGLIFTQFSGTQWNLVGQGGLTDLFFGISPMFNAPVKFSAVQDIAAAGARCGTLFSSGLNVSGAVTQTTGAVSLAANAASSFTTSAGALTITAAAASIWSTSAGALTADAATALNLGTANATSVSIGRAGQSVGFFGVAAAVRQTSGANLTNNVTAGGVDDTIANYTDLAIYANDAAAIRNDIYQLARKVKQLNDGLRTLGPFT